MSFIHRGFNAFVKISNWSAKYFDRITQCQLFVFLAIVSSSYKILSKSDQP